MEPFEKLPTAFTVTKKEWVFFDGDGNEIGTGASFADSINLGVEAFHYDLRPKSVWRVTDIMDVMATLTYPVPGSLGWATALEDAIRGETITVTDADEWPLEITADLTDGGLEPPPLPPVKPIAWELQRDDETAVEAGGRVWRTDMWHVLEAVRIMGGDGYGPHASEWLRGDYGCGDDPGMWSDAERDVDDPIAWVHTWPGGRQTVSLCNGGMHADLWPQDFFAAVAWAAAHPCESESRWGV